MWPGAGRLATDESRSYLREVGGGTYVSTVAVGAGSWNGSWCQCRCGGGQEQRCRFRLNWGLGTFQLEGLTD